MGYALTLALLVALAAVAYKTVAARLGAGAYRRSLAAVEGTNPDTPVVVGSYAQVDEHVNATRCPCGGLLEVVSEGSRRGLRAVHCECIRCDGSVTLFYRVRVLH